MPSDKVPPTVRTTAGALTAPTPMRRGSVAERTMKCGQPGCRCHHDPTARHGPYYSLTRADGGTTTSRYLTAEQAALARQQVEAGHHFRAHLEAYWRACEGWADAQLDAVAAAPAPEGAEKGGSPRPSARTSRRRSRP
jgi:hypothetical protein